MFNGLSSAQVQQCKRIDLFCLVFDFSFRCIIDLVTLNASVMFFIFQKFECYNQKKKNPQDIKMVSFIMNSKIAVNVQIAVFIISELYMCVFFASCINALIIIKSIILSFQHDTLNNFRYFNLTALWSLIFLAELDRFHC